MKRNRISSQIILFILLVAPVFIFLYSWAISQCNGSFVKLFSDITADNQLIYRIFSPPFRPVAWRAVAFLILIQYVFSIILPHDEVHIQNSSGEREWKKINGFASYILVLLLYVLGSALGFYRGSVIYEQWTELLSLFSLLCVVCVVVLYIKAHIGEIATGSDPICDLFFGSELAPTIYDIDVKHFVTYRLAFSAWAIYDVSAIYHNYGLYGKVNIALVACVVLQLAYIGRSQWFEYLHYTRLDSQVDKAGFYRIWGVLVFLPTLYITPVTLLAQEKRSIPLLFIVLLFVLSLVSIYLNADIDRQKFQFRMSNGNTKIWGKDPFFINAKYRRENGDTAVNLLLGSGWWCFSRHLNYLTEWMSFVFWTLLQGRTTFLSYLPLLFLAVFLYLRMKRDETRCLAKYGQHWLQYANRVPFLLIPNVY